MSEIFRYIKTRSFGVMSIFIFILIEKFDS